jgi:Cof subfamily protein (haloacid dehalogenase superfamily)
MGRAYDAILLDLDGTLLDSSERIPPRTAGALRAARADGVVVMTVTGRSLISARPVMDELRFDAPTVLFNGCAVWCPKEERLVEERTLSNRTNRAILSWALARDAQVIVMTANEKVTHEPRHEREARNFENFYGLKFVPREELFHECTIRLSVLVEDSDSERVARELELAANEMVYVSHFPLSILPRHRTNPYSAVDAHPPCRGKAEALRVLHERYGIEPHRVVAVGDAENDVPMLRASGLGVAMGNGQGVALQAADRVIGTNDSDALAELVEELFLCTPEA